MKNLQRAVPTAGDRVQQRPNRKSQRAEHDGGLDHVRPDDRLDAAQRGVERGGCRQKRECADVNPDLLQRFERHAGDHLIAEHQHDRRHVEARAAGQRPRDQKHGGRPVFRAFAKAHQQELVNRDDAVVVIRFDEHEGDDHPRQDRADGKLCVGVVAQGVPLVGRAEKGRGADLRREDRRQNRPPRDAPVADREAFHGFVAPAFVQADADHNNEIREDHPAIEEPRHKLPIIHDPAAKCNPRRFLNTIPSALSYFSIRSILTPCHYSPFPSS